MKYNITLHTDGYKLAKYAIKAIESTIEIAKKKAKSSPFKEDAVCNLDHNFEPALSLDEVKAELLRLIGEHNTEVAIHYPRARRTLKESVNLCLLDAGFKSQVAELLRPCRFRDGGKIIINPVFAPICRDTNPDESKVALELYY